MITLNLETKEVELLKKSLEHCLETCKEGGAKSGCTDCTAIEGILKKIADLS